MKKVVTIFVGILMIACTGSQSNSKQESRESYMVICPMCGGTGTFEYIPGDIMAPCVECACCKGTGMCTIEQAEQIQEIMQSMNQYIYGIPADNTTYSTRRSVAEIQFELDKAYRLLYDTQRNYENCSSGVLRAQYPALIQQQKETIRRLEQELRNATY